MRFFYSLLVYTIFILLVGCGNRSGPIMPVQVTEEQKRQYQDTQQKIKTEELEHHRQQGMR